MPGKMKNCTNSDQTVSSGPSLIAILPSILRVPARKLTFYLRTEREKCENF